MEPALSLPLAPDPSSPAVARSHALELVRPWASEVFASDTALVVTELVANSVLHAGTDLSMEISVETPITIRVEVFDGSFILPVLQEASSDAVSGRGLRLVDAIATCWGARQRMDGKVVWCELRDEIAVSAVASGRGRR